MKQCLFCGCITCTNVSLCCPCGSTWFHPSVAAILKIYSYGSSLHRYKRKLFNAPLTQWEDGKLALL